MTHRIFALHRTDLAAAAQLAQQLLRSGAATQSPRVTVLDPVLQHQADMMGLPGVHLLRLPDTGVAADGTARALAATRLLCADTDAAMATLIPEARGAAWCSHWLKMLHFMVLAYRSALPHLAQVLHGETINLLLPDTPQRYGFHSFMPGLVLHEGLRAAGLHTQLFANPLPAWDAPRLPDPQAQAAAGDVDLLAHLPTCFYDSALFCSEVLASGRRALALPSQLFDAETPGLPRCAMVGDEVLAERLTATQRSGLDHALDAVGAALARGLSPLLDNPGKVQQQVLALVQGFRANALLFFALQARFGERPPATLLISNHDAGLHGGLLSFARRHRIRTVVVPHSKVFNFPLHSYGHDLLCLTHPLGRREVMDLDSCRLPTALLDFAKPLQVKPTEPVPLATLGVVLNSVSAGALCLLDLDAYLAGLAQLLAWCREHGVACRIRCRPTESSCQLLAAELGIAIEELHAHQQGSLVEFGAGCDLVLGYDVPTSGVFDLLNAGQPVMQALCRRLSPEEYRIVDDAVVPTLALPEALARLAVFRHEPLALWQFRREQLHQQWQAGLAARPLRAYL